MPQIEDFIALLSKQKNTKTIFNPYQQPVLSDNLRFYLKEMTKIKTRRVLLVGEAPGYKGCKITGIPFTSSAIFEEIDHPIINKLKKKVKFDHIESENTASIVWRHLITCKITPLFWNAFPFHPHPLNKADQNRAPRQSEIKKGVQFLTKLQAIFGAKKIMGIGKSGTKAAQLAFPEIDIEYIRHPSFGGKTAFINGIDKVLK